MPQTCRRTVQSCCTVRILLTKMPSERRLAIRYNALHRCLSKGIHFTAAELRRYAGDAMRRELDRPDIADPSLRTLKEDLKRLREGAG